MKVRRKASLSGKFKRISITEENFGELTRKKINEMKKGFIYKKLYAHKGLKIGQERLLIYRKIGSTENIGRVIVQDSTDETLTLRLIRLSPLVHL